MFKLTILLKFISVFLFSKLQKKSKKGGFHVYSFSNTDTCLRQVNRYQRIQEYYVFVLDILTDNHLFSIDDRVTGEYINEICGNRSNKRAKIIG